MWAISITRRNHCARPESLFLIPIVSYLYRYVIHIFLFFFLSLFNFSSKFFQNLLNVCHSNSMIHYLLQSKKKNSICWFVIIFVWWAYWDQKTYVIDKKRSWLHAGLWLYLVDRKRTSKACFLLPNNIIFYVLLNNF